MMPGNSRVVLARKVSWRAYLLSSCRMFSGYCSNTFRDCRKPAGKWSVCKDLKKKKKKKKKKKIKQINKKRTGESRKEKERENRREHKKFACIPIVPLENFPLVPMNETQWLPMALVCFLPFCPSMYPLQDTRGIQTLPSLLLSIYL